MKPEIAENTAPFNSEERDYFKLTPTERKLLDKILGIFSSNGGVYAVAGNRGAGKSSLKNMAIYKDNKKEHKNLILNVSYYGSNQNFYRDLLFELINGLAENLEIITVKVEQKINELQHDEVYLPSIEKQKKSISAGQGISYCDNILKKIQLAKVIVDEQYQEIKNHINSLKKEIRDSAIKKGRFRKVNLSETLPKETVRKIVNTEKIVKDISNLLSDKAKIQDYLKTAENQLYEYNANVTDIKKYIRDTTVQANFSGTAEITNRTSRYNWIRMGIKADGSAGLSNNKQISKEIKFENSEEIKINQILNLLSTISPVIKITIAIDELDKLDNSSLLNFINVNKKLLLDTGINTLLIMDIYSCIFLLEESDYLSRNRIVLVPSLTFQEYLEKKRLHGFTLSENIFNEFEGYFNSKTANRGIVGSNHEYQIPKFPRGFVLFKFMETEFIKKFDPIYREVFIKFVWELLDILNDTDILSQDQIKSISDKFIEKNCISSHKVAFNLEKVLKHIDRSYSLFPLLLNEHLRRSKLTKIQRKLITRFCNSLFALQNVSYIPGKVLLISKNSLNPHTTNPSLYWRDQFEKLLLLSKLNANDIYELLIRMSSIRNLPPDSLSVIKRADDMQRYSSEGIYLAYDIIRSNNTLGVVIFFPQRADGLSIINGLIFSYNSFDEYVYFPILGYPGFHSHKPSYYNEFKTQLISDGIPLLELPKNDNLFLSDVDRFINDNISDWVKVLRNEFLNKR